MQFTQKLIVVVEDDVSLNQAVCRLLQAAGHRTLSFASAEAALAVNLQSADCLLLDIRLSGMSGTELFERLTASGSTVPAVFVSAYDHPQFRARASGEPVSTFLSKPYAGSDLLRSLDSLMAQTSAK